jgi:hypothetical protein
MSEFVYPPQIKPPNSDSERPSLASLVSWAALIASIALQAGVLFTRVETLREEVRELRVTTQTVREEQQRRSYMLSRIEARLARIERRLKLD